MKTRKVLTMLAILFALFSCTRPQETSSNAVTSIPNQDMDSLFNGIEMAIFRPSIDTADLVYCFKFTNGRGCITRMRPDCGYGFFIDINEQGIDTLKHSLINENECFKQEYGCDVAQITAVVRFCSKYNFFSVTRHFDKRHSTARYTCHTSRSILFYSKDSVFFNENKYRSLGHHWYRPIPSKNSRNNDRGCIEKGSIKGG